MGQTWKLKTENLLSLLINPLVSFGIIKRSQGFTQAIPLAANGIATRANEYYKPNASLLIFSTFDVTEVQTLFLLLEFERLMK